jgi:DNA-binding NarL/FixJ family response regulator
VVVLSQHADDAYAFELFKNGTAGLAYLLKDRVGDLDQLRAALTAIACGGSSIDPVVVEAPAAPALPARHCAGSPPANSTS